MVECRQPIGFSEAAIAIDDQANVVWLGTSFHLMQQIAFVNTIEDGGDFHPDMTPYSVSGRIIPKPFANALKSGRDSVYLSEYLPP